MSPGLRTRPPSPRGAVPRLRLFPFSGATKAASVRTILGVSQMSESKVGVGVALGIALGAALGIAFDNLGLWIGVGLAVGAALGAAWTRVGNHKKDRS
jgi:hypothetical protein